MTLKRHQTIQKHKGELFNCFPVMFSLVVRDKLQRGELLRYNEQITLYFAIGEYE